MSTLRLSTVLSEYCRYCSILTWEKKCQKKPTNVTCSATFVVDTRKLQNPEDIKKDEFGIWKYSGSHPQPFLVTVEEGGSLWIERCASGATGSNVVHLRRLHCTHPSNPDFRRMICFLSGMLLSICVWKGVHVLCVDHATAYPHSRQANPALWALIGAGVSSLMLLWWLMQHPIALSSRKREPSHTRLPAVVCPECEFVSWGYEMTRGNQ